MGAAVLGSYCNAVFPLILRTGGGELGGGFVTGFAGPSGNALNDELRILKEKEQGGEGRGEAADP